MKLYNTPTRQLETITPLNPPAVTVYTCGPTVYDYPHIGNWYTFIRYDMLVRALRLDGYEPRWVMNITNVGHLVSDADEGEDKLERGARREGKSAWEIADYYSRYFLQGLERLHMQQPDLLPKATEHIPEQIELVKNLEAKGYTYRISDGIYYDTSKFTTYADFARLDIEEMKAGARVEYNPEKRQITDFALWKFSPQGVKRDMEWESPWGIGFPGWHLECSAMSMHYLGETIDVHAGGIDHIPVHHTNEIAQSEAATGKRFVNYWMHTNHISVNGQKISKSLGNTILLEDIEAKGYVLETFRLLVLESHYRTQSKFSWEAVAAAASRLKHWQNTAILLWQPIEPNENSVRAPEMIRKTTDSVTNSLTDDLNTPEALKSIDELFDVLENSLIDTRTSNVFEDFLAFLDKALGIPLLKGQARLSQEQTDRITQREAARRAQDWQLSDKIRVELSEQGIGLRDTPSGTIWYRQ